MVKVIFQLVIFRQTVEIGILYRKDVVDGRTANGTHEVGLVRYFDG